MGVDISKAQLDAFCLASGRRLAVGNDAAGVAELAAWLQRGNLVVMAASGGYERLVHRLLVERGLKAAIVNALRVRQFAKGTGLLAKTDRLDAAVIARYGAFAKPAPAPIRAGAREALAEPLAYRRQLLAEITARTQQLAHLRSPSLIERARAALQRLGQDKAELPELGSLGRRQITSLVGLAPIAKDSGLMRGCRVIHGGRKEVRCALDMAALALSRRASRFAVAYRALVAKGKPKKLALVAVMRKLLVTLNAIAKTQSRWREQPLPEAP